MRYLLLPCHDVYRACCPHLKQLPWLILYTVLSLIPLQAVVYYMMLVGYDVGPWGQAVQYAQAIMSGVSAKITHNDSQPALTGSEGAVPQHSSSRPGAVPQAEFFMGIYACVRMYRLQKQQFYQFEYVMNQRRRNAAYNVDGTSRAAPAQHGGGGIGSNGGGQSRQQTTVVG